MRMSALPVEIITIAAIRNPFSLSMHKVLFICVKALRAMGGYW